MRPARRLRPGQRVEFDGPTGATLRAEIRGRTGDVFVLEFEAPPDLDALGEVPLPPYIVARRRALGLPPLDPDDERRYQTVFAEGTAQGGSIAAPTAGLHFDDELLAALEAKGIRWAPLRLDVGPGTFRTVGPAAGPIEVDAEAFAVPRRTLALLADLFEERQGTGTGGRLVAVGTTATRTLETLARRFGPSPGAACNALRTWLATDPSELLEGTTRLVLRPGSPIHWVDLLVTNFHLPRSTLLLLVSAFAGENRIEAAYRHAVERGYRFYSYGDAMILRRSGGEEVRGA